MKEFAKLIQAIYPLPEDDLRRLLEEGSEMIIPKRTVIFREGEIDNSLYLLKSGIVRAYCTYKEREITIWFATAGEAVYSSWGFTRNLPSRITIAASTDVEALVFHKEEFDSVLLSSEALSVWGRKLFERLLLSTDQWLVDFAKPFAADRYSSLIEKAPEILQHVPLKEIAGYLSMTPQSLSRIRAKYIRKKS